MLTNTIIWLYVGQPHMCRMDEFSSAATYQNFDQPSGEPLEDLPARYKSKNNPEKARARAEARRTRRTMRMQQQQQQKLEEQRKREQDPDAQHYKISYDSEESDSSIDENYDVASIAESETEILT